MVYDYLPVLASYSEESVDRNAEYLMSFKLVS